MEKYLNPLVDNLIMGVVEEECAGMTVREEDKRFIARVFSYIFIGVMMDWIKDDMREEPKEIVAHLSKLIQGSIAQALARFQL